jgi:uncharacterized protein (TIGR03437 family)
MTKPCISTGVGRISVAGLRASGKADGDVGRRPGGPPYFPNRITNLLLAAMLLPTLTFAYEYGPDPRYTGAPGDNPLACSNMGCHTGLPAGGPLNAYGGAVIASFSGGSSYTPGGAPITITVSVTDPKNTHYGFQMTARLESNLANGQAGDFTTGGPDQLVLCDDGSVKIKKCPSASPVEFIEHAFPAGSQVSTTPYTFTWTPPATNVGQVHFYVAGNSVNGNLMADAGDHVYTADYILTPVLCTTTAPTVNGVISAGAYGGALPSFASTFASGSWIEIYGSNFASDTWQWNGIDFNGANAPTMLAGVDVSIDGKPAYIWFLSSGQVNVLAPADTATGPVKITLTNCGNTSAQFTAQKAALAPGLLAPPYFLINGKQYLEALFQDGAAVGNTNLVPGIGLTFRPAKPGDLLTFYGIGFGAATASDGSSIQPGTVVAGVNSLVNPVTINFGSTPASLVYSGLTPLSVGLYQFDVTVPNVANGDIPINVAQNGKALAQALYLTIHN